VTRAVRRPAIAMNQDIQRYTSGGVFREFIDGVLRREQPEKNGILRCWHANGALAKECTLIDGKVCGLMREFHENGKILRETPYIEGMIHGMVKQWNSVGILLGEYEMKKGRGVARKWYEDGSPSLEMENITSNAIRGKVWDDLGKVREVFLWNGKPVSKKKFHKKLAKS